MNQIANDRSRTYAETGKDRGGRSHGLSTTDLVYIAVLAAIWAASENILGAQLHAMNIPFSGVPLAAIAVFLMVTCRSLVQKVGSVMLMGAVVALLKILSIGGVVLSPMIAILMEALLVELAMTLGGTTQVASSVGGMLAEMWTFVHPFVVQPLLFGSPMLVIYRKTITAGASMIGIDPANVVVIMAALVVLHGALGVIAGVVGWRFSARAKRVLSR